MGLGGKGDDHSSVESSDSVDSNIGNHNESTKRTRSDSTTNPNRLQSKRITIPWLKKAVNFTFHNIRTKIPGTNKTFWTKSQMMAYLRTCGCTNKLIETIYTSSRNGLSSPVLPVTWNDDMGIDRCHYAPKHMIFLGLIKNVLEILNSWLVLTTDQAA